MYTISDEENNTAIYLTTYLVESRQMKKIPIFYLTVETKSLVNLPEYLQLVIMCQSTRLNLQICQVLSKNKTKSLFFI